jgi:hypothetical protein
MPDQLASVLGFTGHRFLAEPDKVRRELEEVMRPWIAHPKESQPILLTGFAEGADRLAVEVWRAGGGKVHALFPYPDPDSPKTHAWTDNPATANPKACRVNFAAYGFDGVTIMEPTSDCPSGHELVAKEIAGQACHLIAVWDGDGRALRPGGTAHSVAMARATGVPVSAVAATRASATTGGQLQDSAP